MASVTPDTPDYQRGVVSAQKLLATVAAGTKTVTVGIPPNAESVTVIVPQSGFVGDLVAIGQQTLMRYPVALMPVAGDEYAYSTTLVLVSNPVDSQVAIDLDTAPTVDWYVVANTATRMVTETTVRSVMAGRGAATPTAGLLVLGSDGTDAHPIAMDTYGRVRTIPAGPTAWTLTTGIGTNEVTLLDAPASGANYLYWANAEQASTNLNWSVSVADVLRITGYSLSGQAGPTLDLQGFRVTGAVGAFTFTGTVDINLGYAPGP